MDAAGVHWDVLSHYFPEFVGWAGTTVTFTEGGKEQQAAALVVVLGASDYLYAGVYRDMPQSNWLQAHIDALQYIGGVPETVVPDNPRTAVSRACPYDPDLKPTYQELAEHYAVAVIPSRPRKPRDKAKAEKTASATSVSKSLPGSDACSSARLATCVKRPGSCLRS